MMTTEPMTTRWAHYTALIEIMDHQGSAKLHAGEPLSCRRAGHRPEARGRVLGPGGQRAVVGGEL